MNNYNMNQNPYGNPYAQYGGNMGGYYTNNYVRKNPYLEQQMAMQRRREMEMMQKNQMMMMQRFSRNVHRALGESEAQINMSMNSIYNNQLPYQGNIDEEYLKYMEIQRREMQLEQRQQRNDYIYMMKMNRQAQIEEGYKTEYPDDMSLLEFFEKAGDLYLETLEDERKSKEKDLRRIYNNSQYNQLLNRDAGGSYFTGFSRIHSDTFDPEIQLPEDIKRNFDERRQKFIEAIMK